MSDVARYALIAGVVLTFAAMVAIMLWDRQQPPDDVIKDPIELARWSQELTNVEKDFGLAATRAAAGKWAASAAAILGVLSTVAVVAGPSNLVEDVGGAAAKWAGALTLIAGSMAAVAVLLAGIAEQGTPTSAVLSPGGLRARSRSRAMRASKQIMWSRVTTAIALVLIVTATGIAWLTALTRPTKAPTQLAIVTTASSSVCGPLTSQSDGSITVTAGASSMPVPGNARIKLVDACPP